MINDPRLPSAGTALNRMMDSLGFPDQVGDVYGAALDAALGNNAGVAQNLFDAFAPLSTGQLDLLTKAMGPSASMARPNIYYPGNRPNPQGYAASTRTEYPTLPQMQQIVGSMINRLNPQNFASAIAQLSGAPTGGPIQNLPEALCKTFEQLISSLEGKIEQKLDAEAQAPAAGKKRRKKGGLSKLKKKFKSVSKFAKKTFKSVTKPLEKSFSAFLSAIKTGDVFQMGRAFMGGFIGGPVGSFVLERVMKLAGKRNPLQQVFHQVHKTLGLVQNMHQQQADLQRSLLTKFLR